MLRPPADTREDQDHHKDPEDVSNSVEGDCGFESHLPVEEFPKVCLIKDGKSPVWTVFGVTGPRGLLPPKKTKLLLFFETLLVDSLGQNLFVCLWFCMLSVFGTFVYLTEAEIMGLCPPHP